MTPNNESNKGNSCDFSPSFLHNRGRLSRLPPEERKKIAQKGGLARSEKKKLSSQLNPIKTGNSTKAVSISKCNECLINDFCDYYKKDSACSIELNVYRNMAHNFKAFIGNNPKDMLVKIMKTYIELEQQVNKDPSEYKLTQQIYLLMKIYEMKFGRGSFSIKSSTNINPSDEIKQLMKQLKD